jgi:hypothetical protein
MSEDMREAYQRQALDDLHFEPPFSDGDDYPEPTWVKECDSCGWEVERYRGQSEVSCGCGAQYNAFGQRLRDDWRGNRSNYDEDVSDMDGFEDQYAGDS